MHNYTDEEDGWEEWDEWDSDDGQEEDVEGYKSNDEEEYEVIGVED